MVFTKYDLLVVEHFRDCNPKLSVHIRNEEAKKRALRAFSEVTKRIKEIFKVPFVPTSSLKSVLKEYGGRLIIFVTRLFPFKSASTAETMLVELSQVTRDNLQDVAGPLRALWASAQQVDAHQKVELSIRCIFSAINMH